MMFPAAANGHMPFVDRYREEQIRKIIMKAERQRRHSGPDKFESPAKGKDDRIRSLPALHNLVGDRAKPRFLSTPEMAAVAVADRRLHHSKDGSSKAADKHSFLAGLRKLFGKVSKAAAGPAQLQPRDSLDAGRPSDRSASVPIGIKKAAEPGDGTHKSKRQRTRTVSNISTVMETILEQNETLCSTEDLSSSPSSSVSSSSPLSSYGSPAMTSKLHTTIEGLRTNGYVYG